MTRLIGATGVTSRTMRTVSIAILIRVFAIMTLGLSVFWLGREIVRQTPSIDAHVGVLRAGPGLRAGEQSLAEDQNERIEAALRRSLALSPLSSQAWLELARLTARFDWLNRTSSRALKMSYYTGFNQLNLIEPRLSLLVRIDLVSDSELELLLRRQVRAILFKEPELKATLDRIRSSANDQNRRIIDLEIEEARAPGSRR